ncbi:uncharacterized protein AMSG_01058 [Thecamonas trahens ATCC 50062]|uniref:Uncharacterized protein n=1 Tax=Thecamonas trahens ATCC 50062 TaxID=461836 RepID=A0A0L0DJ51_THETB|nr:hypothetical protein AMSG_01058 [Thecamonas trahens ATCC 50062]KNC52230.1 hypothetical protein AMSG_01058 [Thecamonas trahens ATCC 50062]|eukprot:XP_013762232.1 hypothetical protein AMSG_01058 [Thecamonas trahens ATCC 50062]
MDASLSGILRMVMTAPDMESKVSGMRQLEVRVRATPERFHSPRLAAWLTRQLGTTTSPAPLPVVAITVVLLSHLASTPIGLAVLRGTRDLPSAWAAGFAAAGTFAVGASLRAALLSLIDKLIEGADDEPFDWFSTERHACIVADSLTTSGREQEQAAKVLACMARQPRVAKFLCDGGYATSLIRALARPSLALQQYALATLVRMTEVDRACGILAGQRSTALKILAKLSASWDAPALLRLTNFLVNRISPTVQLQPVAQEVSPAAPARPAASKPAASFLALPGAAGGDQASSSESCDQVGLRPRKVSTSKIDGLIAELGIDEPPPSPMASRPPSSSNHTESEYAELLGDVSQLKIPDPGSESRPSSFGESPPPAEAESEPPLLPLRGRKARGIKFETLFSILHDGAEYDSTFDMAPAAPPVTVDGRGAEAAASEPSPDPVPDPVVEHSNRASSGSFEFGSEPPLVTDSGSDSDLEEVMEAAKTEAEVGAALDAIMGPDLGLDLSGSGPTAQEKADAAAATEAEVDAALDAILSPRKPANEAGQADPPQQPTLVDELYHQLARECDESLDIETVEELAAILPVSVIRDRRLSMMIAADRRPASLIVRELCDKLEPVVAANADALAPREPTTADEFDTMLADFGMDDLDLDFADADADPRAAGSALPAVRDSVNSLEELELLTGVMGEGTVADLDDLLAFTISNSATDALATVDDDAQLYSTLNDILGEELV